jgi:hypothetical protein
MAKRIKYEDHRLYYGRDWVQINLHHLGELLTDIETYSMWQGKRSWKRGVITCEMDRHRLNISCPGGNGVSVSWDVIEPSELHRQLQSAFLIADLEVRPTPEQLLGFKTQAEQKKVQTFLLTAPPDQLHRYAQGERIPSVSFPVAYVLIPEALVEPPEQTTLWAVKGGAA